MFILRQIHKAKSSLSQDFDDVDYKNSIPNHGLRAISTRNNALALTCSPIDFDLRRLLAYAWRQRPESILHLVFDIVQSSQELRRDWHDTRNLAGSDESMVIWSKCEGSTELLLSCFGVQVDALESTKFGMYIIALAASVSNRNGHGSIKFQRTLVIT